MKKNLPPNIPIVQADPIVIKAILFVIVLRISGTENEDNNLVTPVTIETDCGSKLVLVNSKKVAV